MSITRSALIGAALAASAFCAVAQQISQPPEQQIRAMTPEQVDRTMQDMATTINQSVPMVTDRWITVRNAAYLKPLRILNYTVSIAQAYSAQDVAEFMKPNFCAGRVNLALMDRGVTYQYSVTTPAETFSIRFTRADCR